MHVLTGPKEATGLGTLTNRLWLMSTSAITLESMLQDQLNASSSSVLCKHNDAADQTCCAMCILSGAQIHAACARIWDMCEVLAAVVSLGGSACCSCLGSVQCQASCNTQSVDRHTASMWWFYRGHSPSHSSFVPSRPLLCFVWMLTQMFPSCRTSMCC